eukprot:1139129-Pelagomonas_calceolata.AAC.2
MPNVSLGVEPSEPGPVISSLNAHHYYRECYHVTPGTRARPTCNASQIQRPLAWDTIVSLPA